MVNVKEISIYEFIDSIRKNNILGKYFNKFIIPDYQREYVWSEDQVSNFIFSLVDDDVEKFFGFMVFSIDEDRKILNVVDGQQRIITLYLFFLVLLKKYLEDNRPVPDLINFLDNIKIETSYKRVNKFFEKLENIINKLNKKIDEKNKDEYISILRGDIVQKNSKINKNKKEIEKYLSKEINYKKIQDYSKFIEKLKNKKIVVYLCSEEDAYRIFMSLNEKGVKLKPLELIKSYLIGQFQNNKKEIFEKFSNWEDICKENKLSINLQKIIWKYLIYKIKRRFSENDTFNELKKFFENKKTNWDNFKEDIDSILNFLDCRSDKTKEDYKILVRFYLFKILRSHQQWPILIKILLENIKQNNMNKSEILEILDLLLVCFYLLSISDEKFNKFEHKVVKLLESNDLKEKLKDLKNEYLKEFYGKSDLIKEKLKALDKENTVHSLFIFIYLKNMKDNIEKSELKSIIEDSSIEHLFSKSNYNKKINVNSIKYLTIIAKDKNSKISDCSVSKKLKKIKDIHLYKQFNEEYLLNLCKKCKISNLNDLNDPDHEFWEKREEKLIEDIKKILLEI